MHSPPPSSVRSSPADRGRATGGGPRGGPLARHSWPLSCRLYHQVLHVPGSRLHAKVQWCYWQSFQLSRVCQVSRVTSSFKCFKSKPGVQLKIDVKLVAVVLPYYAIPMVFVS